MNKTYLLEYLSHAGTQQDLHWLAGQGANLVPGLPH